MRTALALSAIAALTSFLTACGGSSEPPANEPQPTPEKSASAATTDAGPTDGPALSEDASPSEPSGTVVEVTVKGKSVTPLGDRIEAKVGEPITFLVTADRAGGLHVHSNPEQTPEFAQGRTTLKVTIDRPGVVDVEEHESGALVVQLEVR